MNQSAGRGAARPFIAQSVDRITMKTLRRPYLAVSTIGAPVLTLFGLIAWATSELDDRPCYGGG
jgi:hypothetical protein